MIHADAIRESKKCVAVKSFHFLKLKRRAEGRKGRKILSVK